MRGALCVIKLAMSGYVFSTGKDPRQTYFFFQAFFHREDSSFLISWVGAYRFKEGKLAGKMVQSHLETNYFPTHVSNFKLYI